MKIRNEGDDMLLQEMAAVDERYTSKWLKANTEIRGWLVLFLVGLALGGIRSVAATRVDLSVYAGSPCLLAADIAIAVFALCIALYTIFAFTQRKPNAVFWARVYGCLILATNAISLLLDGNEENVAPMVCGIVWLLYLSLSKQVKRVIPRAFRRISMVDWACLTGVIALPVILLCIGWNETTELADYRSVQEAEIRDVPLAYNQRSDGRIIFTIPYGFECDSEDVGGITLFYIHHYLSYFEVCSDYDTDKSTRRFEEYWNSWTLDGFTTLDVDQGTMKVNGNDCFYKRAKQHTKNDSIVQWRFYLLFDDATGKVCVVSYYDYGDISNSYVDELLESIIFHT